jgi:signal transduction histidine kinase
MRLLAQLLAEFYESKRREETLRLNAYMQAVHETGARVTHDVKNLLQSLYTLASPGQDQTPGQSAAYARMLKRQLPELTRRLQLTLDKMRSHALPETTLQVPAAHWWDELKLRYEGRQISFLGHPDETTILPANLFDSAADNCIENARRKQLHEPEVVVEVELRMNPILSLSITDNGSAVPASVERDLFLRPIAVADGMGIALYQAQEPSKGGRIRA